MIRHTLLFKLKPDVAKNDIETVFTFVVESTAQLNGILSIAGGTCYFHNQRDLDRPFTHGLSIDFADQVSRDAFLSEQSLLPIKESIGQIALNGPSGVINFDFGEWS